jgi:phenol hydroxylase P3 protein
VHQIYQGNCGGTDIPAVLNWYGIIEGVDNGEYLTSPDKANWDKWHTGAVVGGA